MCNIEQPAFNRLLPSLKQGAPTRADYAPSVVGVLHQVNISLANLFRQPRLTQQRSRRDGSLQALTRLPPPGGPQSSVAVAPGLTALARIGISLNGLLTNLAAREDDGGRPVRLEEAWGQLCDEYGGDEATKG